MKKSFLMLLMAALLLSATALADSRVAELGERLFLSLDGLKMVNENGVQTLDSREIRHLQSDGEYIYYVAVEEINDDHCREYLMRMDADGRAQMIGDGRLRGAEYSYGGDYFRLTDYSYYPGYGDMTVLGDSIYFVGSSDRSGSYITTAGDFGDLAGEYETLYQSTSSVYRMNKDGSNLVELIPDLGNGQARMHVNNGAVAVATCWRNSVYAYDFSDFRLYDLNGMLIREIENDTQDRHSWIYKEDCEFTCIVNRVHTDGQRIFASLSDSEGDFANSRLTDMDNYGETLLLEAFFTPAVVEDDGLAAFTSDAEDAFFDSVMETSLTLQWVDEGGSRILAHIPYEFVHYEMHLDKIGDMLYLSNARDVVRVSMDGGMIEKLGEDGFAPTEEFNPENYVPGRYFLHDSNTRLYSAQELEFYDKETLGFMRNEILARHGYVFKKDIYKNHFNAQGWYTPNPGFKYSMLNEIEMANVETIKALEAKK